jgi:two-component system nitrate/nitrite response regulator NarP
MSSAPRPKIAIADKNPVIRTGLVDIVARDGRFDVVAAVATGAAFLDLVAGGEIAIGVIGWALPDMTGGDVLLALKKRQSKVRVVVYTGEPANDVLRRTIKAGAWGFISKSDEPPVLLDTIASVAKGRVSFPFIDMDALSHDPLDTLTLRERELLGALANGWSNLQIAARFGISRNTVKYHLKNLYDRLGVNNRAMAVALYMSTPAKRDGR